MRDKTVKKKEVAVKTPQVSWPRNSKAISNSDDDDEALDDDDAE